MKIYTKTGDKGTTMLFGGGRVSKAHIRIHAYGTVDELNSYIGLIKDQAIKGIHKERLREIQLRLFTLGAILAANPEKKNVQAPDLLTSDVVFLEEAIDEMNESLPPLRHFILPGGHTTVSYCHLARCVCRRAERQVVWLDEQEPVAEIVVQYLNRLSDYLFVLARMLAADLEVEEVKWESR